MPMQNSEGIFNQPITTIHVWESNECTSVRIIIAFGIKTKMNNNNILKFLTDYRKFLFM